MDTETSPPTTDKRRATIADLRTVSDLNNWWNQELIEATRRGSWPTSRPGVIDADGFLQDPQDSDANDGSGSASIGLYPNAFAAEDLGKRGNQDVIVVVDVEHLAIVRLGLTSGSSPDADPRVEETLARWIAEYPAPAFDVLLGLGSVEDVMAELPLISGWENARVEEIS